MKVSNLSEIPNPSRIVNIVASVTKQKLDQFEIVTRVLRKSVEENRASIFGSLSRNSPSRHRWYWSTLGKDPCGHSGLRQSSGESRIFPQSQPYITDGQPVLLWRTWTSSYFWPLIAHGGDSVSRCDLWLTPRFAWLHMQYLWDGGLPRTNQLDAVPSSPGVALSLSLSSHIVLVPGTIALLVAPSQVNRLLFGVADGTMSNREARAARVSQEIWFPVEDYVDCCGDFGLYIGINHRIVYTFYWGVPVQIRYLLAAIFD